MNIIDHLIEFDRSLFLFLNGIHFDFLDQFMLAISGKWFWIPFFLYVLYTLIKYYRKETWWILLSVAVAITLADTISVYVFKINFQRLRPTHDPEIQHLVHTVNNYKGGLYSFISSHAANYFAVATLLYFHLCKKRNWGIALFLSAALISYSRIYLGVHFPADITCGAIVGIICGYTVYKVYQLIKNKPCCK